MENSINFIHPKALIQTSTDKKLFVKENGDWKEKDSELFKSEYHLPSEEGKTGDYFAKYYRRYNYIKYSENFEEYPWNINNLTLSKEPLFRFPYNICQKIKGLQTYGEHSLSYDFYNDLNTPYTFSIYAKLGDLSNIQLSLSDYNMTQGIKAKFDLNNGSGSLSTYGNQDNITDINYSILLDDEILNVYRISITGLFKGAIALKAKINVLDEEFNEFFSEDNNTYGLYINGAQISKSTALEPYLYSKGKYASALSFDKLYIKNSNNWIKTSSNLYYLTKEPSLDFGNDGDIAVLDSILRLYPFVKFGNAENVSILDRPLGFMYYNNKEGNWYIKTNKSLKKVVVGKRGTEDIIRTFYSDCRLMIEEPTADHKAIAMAITLNQQTYNTYNRYGLKLLRPGFNPGGNTNFWMRNFSKTKY